MLEVLRAATSFAAAQTFPTIPLDNPAAPFIITTAVAGDIFKAFKR